MHPSQDYAPALVHENSLLARIQEKLAASRFLTYSILFHVIALAFFGGMVVVRSLAPVDDFQAPPIGLTEDPTQILRVDTTVETPVSAPKVEAPRQPETLKLV